MARNKPTGAGSDAPSSDQGAAGDAQGAAEEQAVQGEAGAGAEGADAAAENSGDGKSAEDAAAADAAKDGEEDQDSSGDKENPSTLKICCTTKVIGAMYDHTRRLTIPLMGSFVEVAAPIDPNSWLGVQMAAGLVQVAPDQSKKPEAVAE